MSKEQGLIARCDNGHETRLLLPDHSRIEAELLGGIMDGTSPFYVHPPREDEQTMIGRCAYEECGAPFHCTLFGFEP